MSFRGVANNGAKFLAQYPRGRFWWDTLSRCVLFATGMTSKTYLHLYQNASVENKDILFEAVRQAHHEKRGLVTYMNHVSILDDPLIWGVVPWHWYVRLRYMRWTLGAEDICFKNSAESTFFSLGQVLAVKRFGAGPFQPAIDASVELLNQGRWVHVFPEGFVHQPELPHERTLKYFKWGISRSILEPERRPIVLPMYGQGLESIFPEDKPKRTLGYGFRQPVRYTIGTPINPLEIDRWRDEWKTMASKYDLNGPLPQELIEESRNLRSNVALETRRALLSIKRKLGHPEEDPRLGHWQTWKEDPPLVRLKGLSWDKKALKAHKNLGPQTQKIK